MFKSQGSTKVLVFLKNGLVSRWGQGGINSSPRFKSLISNLLSA